MVMNRRDFLRSSVAGSALAGLGLPAAAFAATRADPDHIDNAVVLRGDNVPHYNRDTVARLDKLLAARPSPPGSGHEVATDSYLQHGAVEELEQYFAKFLGKEDAVFMPTGTLANHVAIRVHCGEHRHALVQRESHVYRDEADTVPTLSGINLVPLAEGKASPTMDEVNKAIDDAEHGPYPIKVGVISLESPVRRADGEMVPYELAQQISTMARAKGIGMHLDGARLLLNAGADGFTVEKYSALFDTVYVSLYKYLGAPFGAVLAGSKAQMAQAREMRHVFGGLIYHGWMPALLALDTVQGFPERFAKVRQAGDRLLAALGSIDGYTVARVPNGTNIHFLEVAPARQAGLAERLKKQDILVGGMKDGRLMLTFNETLVRRSPEAIARAFAG
ncbi:MAG TPA: beta-eliminating lyase-related protein [Pinirhizobacter sp.]|uniref:threonine aldolase family protein n=1 Tax=Pinirhizobacter sp. TaxID=2950432 RepID=UPI002BFAE89D|nr:beta-eliminating lyase-related protein [Pinirhizobacter sp.]HMH68932.1 beta-eliminating lyase-related protein [Pinirhizobacter sp.]